MKNLLIFVTALLSLSSFAKENQSLHQFMIKNFDWEKDPSHIVHVGTRCATVMDAAVWRLSADNRENVKSIAERYKNIADIYMFSSASLAEKINYSSEGYTKLYKNWLDSYKEMGEKNAIKFNDFFSGMLGADFKTCSSPDNYEFYKAILELAAEESGNI